jgi:uncharacterized membrane protein
MTKGRIETSSDGGIGIIFTIMVLVLRVETQLHASVPAAEHV